MGFLFFFIIVYDFMLKLCLIASFTGAHFLFYRDPLLLLLFFSFLFLIFEWKLSNFDVMDIIWLSSNFMVLVFLML